MLFFFNLPLAAHGEMPAQTVRWLLLQGGGQWRTRCWAALGASLLLESLCSAASVLIGEEKKRGRGKRPLDYFTLLELCSLIRSLESLDCVIYNF